MTRSLGILSGIQESKYILVSRSSTHVFTRFCATAQRIPNESQRVFFFFIFHSTSRRILIKDAFGNHELEKKKGVDFFGLLKYHSGKLTCIQISLDFRWLVV